MLSLIPCFVFGGSKASSIGQEKGMVKRMQMRVVVSSMVLMVFAVMPQAYADGLVIEIQAEDAQLSGGAAVDQRGHDVGGKSAYLLGGTATFEPNAPSGHYYLFFRANSGHLQDVKYAHGAHSVRVGSATLPLQFVAGTIEFHGDGDNWCWYRTAERVSLDPDTTLEVSSTWFNGMVDVLAITSDPLYIQPNDVEEQQRPVVRALRVKKGPVLDGVLDDSCWSKTQIISGFNKIDGDGRPQARTQAMIAWSERALHVGVRCYVTDMQGMVAKVTEDEGPVYHDESVEILLDPSLTRKSHYHMASNFEGVRFDQMQNIGLKPWDGEWRVATKKFDDCWEVEYEIPFTAFGVTPEVGSVWGLNLGRSAKFPEEHLVWSCNFGGRHQTQMFGDMQFGDYRRYPYISTSPFQLHSKENLVTGEVVNPLPHSTTVHLDWRLIAGRNVGEATTVRLKIPAGGRKAFEAPLEVEEAGKHRVALSLWNGRGVYHRESLAHELDEGDMALLSSVLQQPYFRDERVAPLTISVNYDEPSTLKATLWKGANQLDQQSKEVPGRINELLSFDIDSLKLGVYRIEVELCVGDTVLAATQHPFEKMATMWTPKVVEIDEKGILLVNGEKRFPVVVWYGHPSEEFASLGADITALGGEIPAGEDPMDYESYRHVISQLDRVHELGLMQIPFVVSYFRGQEDYDALRASVSRLKHHPAILAWYTADEPGGSGTMPDTLLKAKDIIHEIDPNHPVIVLDAFPDLLRDYGPAADILIADPYPIPNHSIEMVGEWTDAAVRAAGPGKPIWMCLQGQGKPWIKRCPTVEETWNMAYQAIVHGANGIGWWCYSANGNGVIGGMVASGYLDEYARLIAQIKTLETMLVNGKKGKTKISDDFAIHSLDIEHEGATYIIAVNVRKQKVSASFSVQGSSAEVLFEDRSLDLDAGQLVDQFAPYEVHIYRSVGQH